MDDLTKTQNKKMIEKVTYCLRATIKTNKLLKKNMNDEVMNE